ncbi:MAG TPA: SCO family protein [Rhodanobacteraceae bacterium]|jgi:protein SCO1/2|nr:SCO family protein [Rhodanobacteraceae bacterium]
MNRLLPCVCTLMFAMLPGCVPAAGFASTQTHVRAPPDLLHRVGFDQDLGAQVPMDGKFLDAHGKPVTLRSLAHGKPILLVPGYFHCVNLCGIVRAGVANAVKASGFTPGQQFNVVLVSIDPRDDPGSALATQRNDAFAHKGAHVSRWHYLTGPQATSAALMRSIGFRYFYDSRNGQYDHAAGVVLLTPQGKVSQYLFGVKFPARTLRLGLVHASGNRIGNIVDQFLLLCCQYDASTGRYSLVIHRVMQGLGITTALMLCVFIVVLRRMECRRRGWDVPDDGGTR